MKAGRPKEYTKDELKERCRDKMERRRLNYYKKEPGEPYYRKSTQDDPEFTQVEGRIMLAIPVQNRLKLAYKCLNVPEYRKLWRIYRRHGICALMKKINRITGGVE